MGYPKRVTFGRIRCRPKEFQSDIFPMHKLKCSSKCPYYIFCMAEIKKISLGDRIKKLRISLQKPYHLFSVMENGEIYLLFENDKGERISFREKTLVGAVKKAEDYLEASQIRSGQNRKIEEEKEKEQPQEIKEENKEGVKTESYARDDKGQKFPDSD